MGGIENIQTAKKYYAAAIQLTEGKNTRALYGICLVQYLNSYLAPPPLPMEKLMGYC
jgi:hypothetical protein